MPHLLPIAFNVPSPPHRHFTMPGPFPFPLDFSSLLLLTLAGPLFFCSVFFYSLPFRPDCVLLLCPSHRSVPAPRAHLGSSLRLSLSLFLSRSLAFSLTLPLTLPSFRCVPPTLLPFSHPLTPPTPFRSLSSSHSPLSLSLSLSLPPPHRTDGARWGVVE